jgi:hypothetical protein
MSETMSKEDFRQYLIAPDSPRILNARGKDPFDYAKPILERPDARFLIDSWMDLYAQPFKGITANGEIEQGLFALEDEGLVTEPIVAAGTALLALLSEDERKKIQYPIHAHEWRSWYNPEFPMNSHGLRLDYVSENVRSAVTNLIQATLAAEGNQKMDQTRSANLYLGELYDLRNIMNEWSYHFLLYGTPSLSEPWGWSMYGHHLAMNCFILGRQMVISPVFLGMEPNVVDRGEKEAFRSFVREEEAGLALIRSLSPALREKAIIYKLMVDPAMPKGRWHFADERHLGAAYQDNRVIPYEGVSGKELSPEQQRLLMNIAEIFLELLPSSPRSVRLRQIESKLDETYFCWIGGYSDDDPFYYRVQSPVIMLEFDHHSGVWLTNSEPAKFHTHVIIRTPNGNDYGKELLQQHHRKIHGETTRLAEEDREPMQYTRDRSDRADLAPATRAEHSNGTKQG